MTFNEQLEANYESVRKFAYGLTKDNNDADDLTQEAMIRAIEKQDQFDGRSFSGWINTILLNLFKTSKRPSRYSTIEINESLYVSSSNEDAHLYIDAKHITNRLTHGIIGANPVHLRLLCLSATGYKHRELSDLFDLPIGSVAPYIMRAREAIRNRLGEISALYR